MMACVWQNSIFLPQQIAGVVESKNNIFISVFMPNPLVLLIKKTPIHLT
jgi:hypothetical protein